MVTLLKLDCKYIHLWWLFFLFSNEVKKMPICFYNECFQESAYVRWGLAAATRPLLPQLIIRVFENNVTFEKLTFEHYSALASGTVILPCMQWRGPLHTWNGFKFSIQILIFHGFDHKLMYILKYFVILLLCCDRQRDIG